MRCLGNHLVPPGGGPPLMVFTREFVFLFDFFSSSAFTWAGDRPRRGIPSRRPPSWRWWAVLRARRTSSCRASPSPRPFRDPRDRPVAASPAPPCGSGPRSRNCSKKKMGTMLAVRTFRQVLVSFEQKKNQTKKKRIGIATREIDHGTPTWTGSCRRRFWRWTTGWWPPAAAPPSAAPAPVASVPRPPPPTAPPTSPKPTPAQSIPLTNVEPTSSFTLPS